MNMEKELQELMEKLNITEKDREEILRLSHIIGFRTILEGIATTNKDYLDGHESTVDTLRDIIDKGDIDIATEYLFSLMFSLSNVLTFLENNICFWCLLGDKIKEGENYWI